MKFQVPVAVTAAFIGSSAAWGNVSEVPLYGLSPPVYPTRELITLMFKKKCN